MNSRGRSPVYEPIKTPPSDTPKEEKRESLSGFEASPLSRYIGKEDIILVWTVLAILVLIFGVFFYFSFGPKSTYKEDQEIPAVGDDGEIRYF